MADPQTGYEFLKQLQKEKADKKPSFADFSDFLEMKARKKGVPMSGIFELTPLCNFSCRMCYVHLTGAQLNGQKVLSPEQWKDLMRQAWEAGMMQATLTGGECLSYPGFDDIYLYLHSLGCEIILMTNGALLDQKRLDFFMRHKPANMQITLYGQNDDVYERVTGQRAFRTVEENIRRIADAGLNFVLNITPNVYLGEDVFETIRTAYRLCPTVTVNNSLFSPREETGRSAQKDDMDVDMYIRIFKLEKELNGDPAKTNWKGVLPEPGGPNRQCSEKGLQCGAGRSCFTLDWKGELFPCGRLRMIQASPLKIGFRKAWESVHQQAESWIREPACSGCPYESICKPCAANVRRYSQPDGRPEEWCKRTIQFVRHGIWHKPEC